MDAKSGLRHRTCLLSRPYFLKEYQKSFLVPLSLGQVEIKKNDSCPLETTLKQFAQIPKAKYDLYKTYEVFPKRWRKVAVGRLRVMEGGGGSQPAGLKKSQRGQRLDQ